jgi:hypothetical protein
MQDTNSENNTPSITRLVHPTRGALSAHGRWATLAIALLTGLGLVATSAPATAHPPQDPNQIVVRASDDGLTLSRNVTDAGRVTITVEAPNADFGGAFMFKLIPPATLATLRADLKDARSDDPPTAARGTRNMTRHAHFYGLAEVTGGRRVSVTQTLSGGTYYLIDNFELVEGSPHLVPLTVRGPSRGHTGQDSGHHPKVSMTANNRFDVPENLPARGTISVRNRSDTPHFMQMWPVVPGTTDKAVQSWLDDGAQGDPGFFVDGPTTALNLLSPRLRAQMTYDIPAGSYLLLCEVRDAKTGMPHVFMGMHKVVTLK